MVTKDYQKGVYVRVTSGIRVMGQSPSSAASSTTSSTAGSAAVPAAVRRASSPAAHPEPHTQSLLIAIPPQATTKASANGLFGG
jgi:hypothetical protein